MEPTSLGQVARLVAALAVATSLSESPACAQVPCRYEVRIVEADYCSASGTSPILPKGINDLDPPTVVGSYRICAPSDDRPFYWISDQSEITLMGLPPGHSAANAADVNNVVGELGVGQIINNYFAGFLWNDGEWIEIPPPPGEANIRPNAIASDRLIVAATSSQKTFHAARWDGKASELLNLPYGTHQFGTGVSPDGSMIVGTMQVNSSNVRGFIWQNGEVTDPGWLPDSTATVFRAVNDFGEAAGAVSIPDPDGHCESLAVAAVWRNEQFTVIGTLPPRVQSVAQDISNTGIVVGYASSYGACNSCSCIIPFVWSHDVGIQDLQRRIDIPVEKLYLLAAQAINEKGEILCSASMSGSGRVAALLIPLPRDGDVNCDERVDLHDLIHVLESWGPCRGCQADLTEDWNVNVDDLLEVINYWNP